MKWSIFGLFGLGFLAAVCAVVLVIALRDDTDPLPGSVGTEAAPEGRRTVLVAAGDFAPRRVIRAEDLVEIEVAESAFPEGAFSEAVQVVGRVLVTPMAKDQAFLPRSFADGGSNLQLASTLTDGLRAYVLALDDDLTTEPLLYPGSFVDVIAAVDVERTDGTSAKDRVGFTLIQGAMVLAVRGRTIVAPSGTTELASARESTAPRSRRSVVTLLVTPADATRLRLAEDRASISLAIRNPVDVEETGTDATRLSELFPLLACAEPEAATVEQDDSEVAALLDALERARKDLDGAKADMREQSASLDAARAALATPGSETRTWETVVLRGGESSLKTFKVDVPKQ